MQDANGSTVWQAQYYPFGNLFSETGSVTNNLRFPGQYDDRIPDASLFYNWNRFYSPAIGRYFQTDPMLFDNSENICGPHFDYSNLFTYSNNNPIINIDPDGEQAQLAGWGSWAWKIVQYGWVAYSAWQCYKHEPPCRRLIENCRERYQLIHNDPEKYDCRLRKLHKTPDEFVWDCIWGRSCGDNRDTWELLLGRANHCQKALFFCTNTLFWIGKKGAKPILAGN